MTLWWPLDPTALAANTSLGFLNGHFRLGPRPLGFGHLKQLLLLLSRFSRVRLCDP